VGLGDRVLRVEARGPELSAPHGQIVVVDVAVAVGVSLQKRGAAPFAGVALPGEEVAGVDVSVAVEVGVLDRRRGEVIIDEPLGYSVGRGMFNNGVTDWADAHIDEVRISDVVLASNQFLFAAVPEPTTGVLVATSGLLFAAAARRKR
jgi:hypothetical protein